MGNIRIIISKYGIQIFELYIQKFLEYLELKDKYNLMKHISVRYETDLYVCLGWDNIECSIDNMEFVILKRVLQLMQEEDISYSYIIDEFEIGKCSMKINMSKEIDVFVPYPEFDLLFGFDDEITLKQLKKCEKEELKKYGI